MPKKLLTQSFTKPIGASILVTMALSSTSVMSEENPFSTLDLTKSVELSQEHDGKCGEGCCAPPELTECTEEEKADRRSGTSS